MDQSLRHLRVWHWRQCRANRAEAERLWRLGSSESQIRHQKADFHLYAVMTLGKVLKPCPLVTSDDAELL